MEAAKQKLLEQTHQTILKVGFEDNDYELVADLISPNFVGFGTALDEKIFGIKDLKALLKRQKEQSRGIDINVEINTLHTHLSENENTAVYIDEGVLSVKTDEEPIEMVLRLSMVLEYIENKWLMVHFHSSKPEEVESEKDTWGIENWKEKAEALEKEVAERTADLVLKNRDLEIEAALERVRARSMAMHSSDELKEVVTVLFENLKELQIPVTAAGIQVYLEDSEDMLNYVCGENSEGLVISHYRMPYFDNAIINDFKDARDKKDGFFVGNYSKKIKDSFYTYLFENTEIKDVPEDIKQMIFDSPAYTISMAPVSNSLIAINDFKGNELSENHSVIIKRFAKVFEQAYIRFRDLQKAEAQAREGQIEAALEKVRSRSMAMHNSQELKEVALELRKQMGLLGQKDLEVCAIHLYGNDEDSFESWSAMKASGSETEIVQTQAHFPKRGIRIVDEMVHHYTIGTKDYILVNEGEKIAEWFKMLKKHAPELHSSILDSIGKVPVKQLKANWAVADFSGGALVMVTYGEPDEVSRNLLRRSANVFEQAYVRFLDLQKAEAQAKEAKIEAALERVRSRSLAMRNSEELGEVVKILVKKLRELKIPVEDGVAIVTHIEGSKDQIEWMENPNSPSVLKIQQTYFDHPILNDYWKAKNTGIDFIAPRYSAKENQSFLKHIFKHTEYKNTSNEIKDYCLSAESYSYSAAFQKHSSIFINHYSGDILTPIEIEVVKRFSKVFEQAYIRFLDLQKAEAQAREAQIEAALEKIRSRSLAVHKSDEFNEVVSIVFEKLKELQIPATAVGIGIKIDGSKDLDSYVCGENEDGLVITNYRLPYFNNKISKDLCTAIEKELGFYVGHYTKKVKNNFYKHILEHTKEFKDLPKDILKMIFESSSYTISMVTSKHVVFNINDFEGKDLTNLEIDIIKRFSKVFNQAYIRFLDLQKAEAQAREAQIENALEKVRGQSMAMHNSDQLKDVVREIFDQMGLINIKAEHAGIVVDYEPKKDWHFWVAETQDIPAKISVPYLDSDWDRKFTEAKKNGDLLFTILLNFEEKNAFYEELLPYIDGLTQEMKDGYFKRAGLAISTAIQKDIGLYIENFSGTPYTEEENLILLRFAKVFQQTYTRFLDLKKAEAQTREVQIEAALEKVRSRSMGMQKSTELLEVITVVSQQLQTLGFRFSHVSFINNSLKEHNSFWVAATGLPNPMRFIIPYKPMPIIDNLRKAQKNKDAFYTDVSTIKEHQQWFEHLLKHSGENEFPKEIIDYQMSKGLARSVSIHTNIMLALANTQSIPYSDYENKIIARFGQVFEQSYTRFLDLQRAESQAREAQIEMSLEKVRSRTMAMQTSSELPEAANTLFLEVQALGIPAWSAGYCIWNEDKSLANCNMSSEGEIQKGFMLPSIGEGYDFLSPLEKDEQFHMSSLGGKDLVKHYDFMKTLPGVGEILSELVNAGLELPTFQIFHICYFKHGYVMFITYEPVPKAHDIFKRFTSVFEQTYTRFLDLKQAEARAREAQIQSALERVRSHSMGMQSSTDFGEVTTEMFNQLRNFGEDLFATGIVFCDKHEGHVEQWHSIPGGGMLSPMIVPTNLDYIHQYRYDQWKAGEELFSIEIPSDFIEQHFEDIFKLPSAQITLKDLESRNAPMPAAPDWEIDYGASFKNGYVLISSLKPLKNTDILPRFAKVFEQAYTRFLDLETAEKNAYKSKVETALERVRARALAMHEPDELKEVASVLRTEMGLLGIEELETCSIYILDDEVSNAECWYALKDAKSKKKKLISDHISMDFTKTWVGQQMLKFHDSEDENTSIAMTGKARVEWIRYCENQSKVLQSYYGEDIPERTYHLHKFSNGAIGAASAGDISEESWVLLKRCASVFSLAYSRFKDLTQAKIDLKRLKTEKKRAEEALSELQTTQKQLIQSEKMASLGELTAGIAHEIQNPLNFVNNFSEVSKELLEEMQEEIENGDLEEVKAIMKDIVQNLEKINHHGQRADAIVKGMLQHSRASGDKKEPTDINALADEYLRLAYHGLRAKDKSFNADLVTDFDNSIESLSVIPQDIGRVILNLLTNAFYVVNERKKTETKDYKPTVKISTKRYKKSIEISVEDNGKGMPDSVKDKIFQPFFTTKPTGEGTGLGLSMSYDIISNGHGGELKVSTMEGEGTTFCILIPNN